LKRLVRAETTAETGELAAAEIVADELAESGIDSAIETWEHNRANLVAHIRSDGKKKGLLFACHLDVVPPGRQKWDKPPFSGTETAGRIYGRGACDMKGAIAAVVTALRQVVESSPKLAGDIVLLCAAGEETDSCGAKRFVAGYKGRLGSLAGVVICEPTDFEVVTTHRGLLWLEIVTKGKAVHGSTPQEGVNAISSMNTLLNALAQYDIGSTEHKLLGPASLSVNKIEGGQAINIVPDSCRVAIDIRTVPGQDHQTIIEDFKDIFARCKQRDPKFEAELSVVRDVGALETDSECDFVRDFCSAVGAEKTAPAVFCTDGPHLVPLGGPVVIFGPGNGRLCHKVNEYIELSDVQKAVEYYKGVIYKVLG